MGFFGFVVVWFWGFIDDVDSCVRECYFFVCCELLFLWVFKYFGFFGFWFYGFVRFVLISILYDLWGGW